MRPRSKALIGIVCLGVGFVVGALWRSPDAQLPQAVSTAVAQNNTAVAQNTAAPRAATPPTDGKLRIICFGAHPDDCELKASGCAALWAAQGHKVKFVSVTNGDIGHWRDAGGPLAQRRTAEVRKCAEILGIETEVLDNHDGELMPTLENRKTLTKLIREWKADVVMGPRTNDYHPDHRYTGVLVQDAAFMVTVPFFCPDIPYLERNPVFMYYPDRFQTPNPFKPDVVVAIDSVIEKKLDALDALVSQFYEGGAGGSARDIPTEPEKQAERRRELRRRRGGGRISSENREKLAEFYGKEQAEKIVNVEAFQVCEYGRQPNKQELMRLFPFFPAQQ